MDIKINLHGMPMPEQHGDWIDLSTSEEVYLYTGDFRIIPLGISMEIPEGYYAEVLPRSSTPEKWGILMANSMGIIDNAYCGDNDIWGFPAVAFHSTCIPKHTRIAQFRLVKKAPDVLFLPVTSLGNEDRGGFGSSGTSSNIEPVESETCCMDENRVLIFGGHNRCECCGKEFLIGGTWISRYGYETNICDDCILNMADRAMRIVEMNETKVKED